MGGPVGAFNASGSGLIAGPRIFYGAGFTAGAAATVEIRDGSAAGAILWSGRLGAAGDVAPVVFARGIATAGGIYVNVVAGSPIVVVFAV